jgi:nucleotide-binding universal stress UspA family protein
VASASGGDSPDAERADAIVMGTHGGTGFSRFFVGSVASRVIATSPYPVLMVRGK